MAELVRTNDPGMVSVIEGILTGAEIPYQLADRHMSVLEGSMILVQVRILVPTSSRPKPGSCSSTPRSATGYDGHPPVEGVRGGNPLVDKGF